jgi:hypothetical protein
MTLNSPTRFAVAAEHHGGMLYRLVSIRCVADCLPLVFYTVVTNGKIAVATLLGAYLIVISLWMPFWLLSFVVTEWGVYAAAVGVIFLIGRSIIRLIAFPGASRKVVTDIESEFAKYSVRMIAAATSSLIDLAIVFEPREQSGDQHLDNRTMYQLPGLWRRVRGFRDRVLGVYLEVLRYIYQQDSISSLSLSTSSDHSQHAKISASSYGPGLTRYGNNRLSGDIGNVASLTVRMHGILSLKSIRGCCLG